MALAALQAHTRPGADVGGRRRALTRPEVARGPRGARVAAHPAVRLVIASVHARPAARGLPRRTGAGACHTACARRAGVAARPAVAPARVRVRASSIANGLGARAVAAPAQARRAGRAGIPTAPAIRGVHARVDALSAAQTERAARAEAVHAGRSRGAAHAADSAIIAVTPGIDAPAVDRAVGLAGDRARARAAHALLHARAGEPAAAAVTGVGHRVDTGPAAEGGPARDALTASRRTARAGGADGPTASTIHIA